MPSPRFWEFEDAQVDFGSVDAGPTDLARMLLVEFALAYGNDWFVLPIELDVGLFVPDPIAGDHRYIRRAHADQAVERARRARRPRGACSSSPIRAAAGLTAPAANLFFLPPSLLQGIDSAPVEEVLFLRDEMANLAWAVERLVESPSERPLNRFEMHAEMQRRRELLSPERPAPAGEQLHYRLSTEVPDYWIPLMPVSTGQGLRLRRGAVLKTQGSPEPAYGIGRILTPETGRALELFEEEIPREGVRVTRSYQCTRWLDGSTHLWIGRRKEIGRGEGSSGLRFDAAESDPNG